MAVLCPYNPKEVNSVKSWCRWEDTQNGGCPLLVQSTGLVKNQYEQYNGRLVLYDEPGNGTYTVILNQLTAQDAGFYWCLTNGDIHWRSTVELKIVEGKSSNGARGKGGSPRTPPVSHSITPTALPPVSPPSMQMGQTSGESPPVERSHFHTSSLHTHHNLQTTTHSASYYQDHWPLLQCVLCQLK